MEEEEDQGGGSVQCDIAAFMVMPASVQWHMMLQGDFTGFD